MRKMSPLNQVISVGVVLSLTGCGGKKDEKATPTSSTTEKSTTAEATAAPQRDYGVVPQPGPDIVMRVEAKLGASSGLSLPRAIVIDESGRIYVADTKNNRIVVFDEAGKQLLVVGKAGTGPGTFTRLKAIAVTGKGKLFALDSGTGLVQIFEGGTYVSKVGDLGLYEPCGLAVQPDGTIVVADTGGNRLLRVSPDGKPVGSPITKAGTQPFPQPVDVSADASGGLHALVPAGGKDGHSSLLNFGADGSFASRWSVIPPSGDLPRTVVGPDGKVYLADIDQGRVLVYSADGKTVSIVKIDGLTSPLRVAGVALDRKGSIYVTDMGANVVYRLGAAAAPAAAAPAAPAPAKPVTSAPAAPAKKS